MKTAILLYAPVIHRGYLEVLRAHGSPSIPVYLFGESILSSLEKKHQNVIGPIRRDTRALSVTECAASLFLLYKGPMDILEQQNLHELHQYDKLILAEDELSHIFVQEFGIPFEKIEFVPWFLRWNMPASTTRQDIESDRTVTSTQLKALGFFKYLKGAREQAAKSPDWWRQVGSVLVRNGEELLGAYNTHLPTVYEVYYSGDPRTNFNAGECIEISKAIHSEASIIAQACQHGIITRSAELYVTTFPCPACANLIALAGIKRVYFADGYSLVGAIDVLRAYNVEVIRVV